MSVRIVPLLALLGCAKHLEPAPPSVGFEACFRELSAALADDALEGRGIGTQGLEQAATLLAERFRAAGLKDAGVDYTQPFQVVTGVALGDGNALHDGSALGLADDFVPLGFSSDGAIDAPVVFAGYGIRAPELNYDDYAGLDVKGKVVLAMRYEPGEDDPDSPFDGRRTSRWSDLRHKAMVARELGAAALVFVTPAKAEDEPDKLPPLKRHGPTSRAGLPVIQITRATADRWLAAAGTDLATVHREIDETYQPVSRELPGIAVQGTIEVVPTEATARNVIGVLPGRGALADEFVVVGAHYDHLGHGGQGSMRPDAEAIHNGADDNASGTAAMVCAIEHLAATFEADNRRTIVGLGFSAEEIGLGGSDYYAKNPIFPMERTVAMVNLDMVGRVREGQLQALGTDSGAEWVGLLTPLGAKHGLALQTGGDGYGPSDHTSFYAEKVPVVHFFSGSHDEYHTPDDVADTLNLEDGARVTALVVDTLAALATREERLTYQRSTAGPLMAGDSRGSNAWLGTVPDYRAMGASEGGVLLSDVRAGGPAERAGLRGGDTLIGLAGAEVQNLYDMTFVLRDHRPGDTVEVVVLRDGAEVRMQATLGSREAAPAGGPHGDPHGAPAAAPVMPPVHADFSVGAEAAAGGEPWRPLAGRAVPELLHADEVHLADLRQLTFGGENAEAYWSPDGRRLIFQRAPSDATCDQQYALDLTTGAVTMLSSGEGRTTCGYYAFPDGERVIYATTEGADAACPPPPDRSQGYVWPLYSGYDLVWHTPGQAPEPFLASPHYDAEATVCQKDGRVVFTSTRDGDLDLYLANADGTGLQRLTDTPGYDGGAFFSHDCTALIYRASRPTGQALADYQRLLGQGLVRPGALDIYWMDLETRESTRLTDNGAANFAPYPLPDDSGVLFSTNLGGDGREFDIWLQMRDGSDAKRITHTTGFDGFPMFSPDGQWLVFASNRATAEGQSDTNLFVARWVAAPE